EMKSLHKLHKIFLDQDDPATLKTIEDLFPGQSGEPIRLSSPMARPVRNKMIFDGALEQIRNVNPDLLVISCGRNHVFGGSRLDDYKYSLDYLFRSAGFDVLPVFIGMHYDLRRIPAEAEAELARSVVIREFSVINTPPTWEEEKQMVERMIKASGKRISFRDV